MIIVALTCNDRAELLFAVGGSQRHRVPMKQVMNNAVMMWTLSAASERARRGAVWCLVDGDAVEARSRAVGRTVPSR